MPAELITARVPGYCHVNGGSSLESVSPTLTYYAGSAATGTPLSGTPSLAEHTR